MKFKDKSKKKGRDFEKTTKSRYGGKLVPGSGSGILKEDVEDGDWLIQNKSTKYLSYSVKHEDLEKVRKEAAFRGKYPRMDIELDNGSPVPPVYVVIPRDVFEHMVRNGSEA